MGREKGAIIQREDDWNAKAHTEGWRCAVCSTIPPYDEREIYFESDMCGYCNHTANKDD